MRGNGLLRYKGTKTNPSINTLTNHIEVAKYFLGRHCCVMFVTFGVTVVRGAYFEFIHYVPTSIDLSCNIRFRSAEVTYRDTSNLMTLVLVFSKCLNARVFKPVFKPVRI